MKISSKILASAILALTFALTGCQKQAQRPNPSQTVFGPAGGSELNPNALGDLSADQNSALQPRDTSLANAIQKRGILPNVYFDFDSSAIRVSERSKLTKAAKYLQDNPSVRLLLEGHCDWRGTAEYNLGLGDRRAHAVKSYLETLGVDGGRLDTLSRGDLDAKEGASAKQMQHDRRVELIVLQ